MKHDRSSIRWPSGCGYRSRCRYFSYRKICVSVGLSNRAFGKVGTIVYVQIVVCLRNVVQFKDLHSYRRMFSFISLYRE
jgi:hypothetical protein